MPETKRAQKPRRATIKIDEGREAKPRKCSLVLSRQNDQRLSIYAALLHIDRSTLLNRILDTDLAQVRGYGPDAEAGEKEATA